MLQITPAATGQAGSAWYTTAQPVGGSFSSTFTFQLTDGSADGFAFVIQNSSAGTSALGPGGCAMGFADDPLSGNNYFCGGATGGIPNSVAIGFKTYTATVLNIHLVIAYSLRAMEQARTARTCPAARPQARLAA